MGYWGGTTWMLIAYREITRRWWWWVTLYGVVRNTLRMKIRKDKERKKHEPKRNRDDANPAYPSFQTSKTTFGHQASILLLLLILVLVLVLFLPSLGCSGRGKSSKGPMFMSRYLGVFHRPSFPKVRSHVPLAKRHSRLACKLNPHVYSSI